MVGKENVTLRMEVGRGGWAHSRRAQVSAFSGQDKQETCLHASAVQAAALILSANGVFHRLLQTSGSTTCGSWSDRIHRAVWQTPASLIALRHQGYLGVEKTTKPNPLCPRLEA